MQFIYYHIDLFASDDDFVVVSCLLPIRSLGEPSRTNNWLGVFQGELMLTRAVLGMAV